MHQIERDHLESQEREYDEWAQAHSAELEAQAHAAWVETLCEGHESLRGDLMGREFYCDGTCRPASERSLDAYDDYLDSQLPTD